MKLRRSVAHLYFSDVTTELRGDTSILLCALRLQLSQSERMLLIHEGADYFPVLRPFTHKVPPSKSYKTTASKTRCWITFA